MKLTDMKKQDSLVDGIAALAQVLQCHDYNAASSLRGSFFPKAILIKRYDSSLQVVNTC